MNLYWVKRQVKYYYPGPNVRLGFVGVSYLKWTKLFWKFSPANQWAKTD
jgi:hypothetical protein